MRQVQQTSYLRHVLGHLLSSTGLIGLALLLTLTACATKTLPIAVKLSQTGQQAASTLQSSIILSDAQLNSLHKFTIFHAAFKRAACIEAKKSIDVCNERMATEKEIIGDIDEIQNILTSDTKWLTSLRESYAALGELANYDASTKFISAFDGLTASTNSLAAALKSTPPSSEMTSIFKYAGGQIVGFVQANKVIAASKAIHAELDRAITLLSNPDIKDIYTSLQKKYYDSLNESALILSNKGTLSFKPLINEVGATAGLAATANTDKLIRENKSLRVGLNAVINETYRQKIVDVTRAYDKSLAALKELAKLHSELENSSGFDATQLAITIGQLQSLAAQADSNK